MDFSKFNSMVDIEGLKKDIEEAKSNNSFSDEKVPYGKYEVSIQKLELTESKKGNPMLSAWFKITEGAHKGRLLFMNQVVTQGFQIHIANNFLKSLDSGMEIEFKDYVQYANLILDVAAKIEMEHLTFALDYSTRNNYDQYKIEDVFEN